MEEFRFYGGKQQDQNFLVKQSNYIDARKLAAGVAEVHTIPTGASVVILSCTAHLYAKVDGAAAIPAADVTNGSASELNPGPLFIKGAITIGLISPSDCVVTLSFY